MKYTHRYNRKKRANGQRKEHESRNTRIQVVPLGENHRIGLEKQVYTAIDKLKSNVNNPLVSLQDSRTYAHVQCYNSHHRLSKKNFERPTKNAFDALWERYFL